MNRRSALEFSDGAAGPLLNLVDDDFPHGLEAWRGQALCAETDPDAFFPEKGGSTRAAKAVCAKCPAAAACLEYALEHDERFGIWGGASERDRRKIKRERQARRRAA